FLSREEVTVVANDMDMAAYKRRETMRFIFWTIMAGLVSVYWLWSYFSGQMVRWYYYTAAFDGYAINDVTFKDASKDKPAMLAVGNFDKIEGLQAVPVKKGGRLPEHTNGIIGLDILKAGKRAVLEGEQIKVTVPWEIKESKGFKYRDTFKHKGILTNPWSGAWNLAMVIAMGLCLGLMAEGLTGMFGLKLHKIKHFEGH
ncbi:MAG TPA: hypothetical protein VES58_03590, partial [Syntrophobacteria bacterium]|nr:hypothetical protein [Syntrophobacteria bacterium]